MKNFKILGFIALCIFISSCGAKKKVSEKVIERDSISYVLPSENTLIISNLCDSVKKPVQVLKTISTGVSTSKVEIKGNVLTVTTKTDTIFKEKISYRDRVKEETIEVPYTPKWIKTLLWILMAGVIIFIAFPKIPAAIQVLAKKLIGIPV